MGPSTCGARLCRCSKCSALAGGKIYEGLTAGLLLTVIVILLLLTAYFQSFRLALAVVCTIPAVLAGVVLLLWATRTTLNIQSFMGSIMAIGVAVANAILLVTFAERARRKGPSRGTRRSMGPGTACVRF